MVLKIVKPKRKSNVPKQEDEELRKTIKNLVDSQLRSLVREEVTKVINSEITRIFKVENGFMSSLLDTKIKDYLVQSEYNTKKQKFVSRLENMIRDIFREKIKLALEDRLMKSFLDLCKEEE